MKLAASVAVLVAAGAAAAAPGALDVYKAMGIPNTKVLNGSVLTSRVLPGEDKQLVALVTFFTGISEHDKALNVVLEVFRVDGDKVESLYARDYTKVNGGPVGRGDLSLVDLDGDGVNEILVAYDNGKDPLVEERRGEILIQDGGAFRAAWTGALEYDSTKAAREVPQDRRDKWVRKYDIRNTLRTKGVTLFVTKTVQTVAGERLAQPKEVQETFPLKDEGK